MTITYRGERHFCPAAGAAGGESGQPAAAEILRTDGEIQVIPSKQVARLMAGDRLHIRTAGGGGYGDPAARHPERLEADIEDGKVTRTAA